MDNSLGYSANAHRPDHSFQSEDAALRSHIPQATPLPNTASTLVPNSSRIHRELLSSTTLRQGPVSSGTPELIESRNFGSDPTPHLVSLTPWIYNDYARHHHAAAAPPPPAPALQGFTSPGFEDSRAWHLDPYFTYHFQHFSTSSAQPHISWATDSLNRTPIAQEVFSPGNKLAETSPNRDEPHFLIETSQKRRRIGMSSDDDDSIHESGPPTKVMRLHQDQKTRHHKFATSLDIPSTGKPQIQNSFESGELVTDESSLTFKQKSFIEQWYRDFPEFGRQNQSSKESINALGTLLHVRPEVILEHVRSNLSHQHGISFEKNEKANKSQPLHMSLSPVPYAIESENAHLTPTIVSQVTKYITTSRRPRSVKDGRRRVNVGQYACTFGCDYRTKRTYDWRRHEETHEPQELFLCHLCRQLEKREPFLASRKDKFLRHVKERHKDWSPEEVLEMSKLKYESKADLGCPKCDWQVEQGGGWDERCSHVVTHFEDEDASRKRTRDTLRPLEEAGHDGDGSIASGSAVSDVSLDDE